MTCPRTTPPKNMRRKDKEITDRSIIDELLATARVCRIALVDAGEKMPFRVTPVIPYLKTYAATPKSVESARD